MDLLTNDEIDQADHDSGRARREAEHRRCVENISRCGHLDGCPKRQVFPHEKICLLMKRGGWRVGGNSNQVSHSQTLKNPGNNIPEFLCLVFVSFFFLF